MNLQKIQIFIVKQDSPAYEALLRMVEHPLEPGRILPVDESEFESFRKDFMVLEIDGKEEEKESTSSQ